MLDDNGAMLFEPSEKKICNPEFNTKLSMKYKDK